MPWIRAKLRGQIVFARCDAAGAFSAEGGRVEIRYKRDDGRLYRAVPQNLVVADASVLDDDYCAPAEAVDKKKADAAAGGAAPGRSGAGPGASGRRSGGGGGGRGASAASPAPAREGEIIAYADGACSGNPGPAGLGVVVADGTNWVEVSEYLGIGTNNIAELRAVMRAIDEIGPRPAVIHTDSSYTIGVAQKGWKAKANQELVAALREKLAVHGSVRLVYVPGHAGVSLNERADALARDALSHRGNKRTSVPTARRMAPAH